MIEKSIFDLTGRTALVTGGSRGLGRAMAEAVAAFGANVMIAARAQEKIDETLEILKAYPVKSAGISADMSSEADIKRMVEATAEEFGTIDILFNNAGIARQLRMIHEEVVEDYDIVMNTNMRGPFLVMKYVLPYMMKQKKGSIILTSSTAGLRAEYPEIAPIAYSCAKAGICMLTQVSALQYAEYGIRVNCIAPGMHESEIGHDTPRTNVEPPSPEMMAAMQEKMQKTHDDIPMHRHGKAEELAGIAVCLASDASSYITGQIIPQDGGRSIKH